MWPTAAWEWHTRSPWIPHRWIFVQLCLKRKQKALFLSLSESRGVGKGIGTVPASPWFDGHLIFQSTIPPGRTWRSPVKPSWWNQCHPSRRPLGKKNQDRSCLPPRGGHLLPSNYQNTSPPCFPPLPPQFVFLKTEEKPVGNCTQTCHTQNNIKQKETWTIPRSLPGFITRCKVKTKTERRGHNWIHSPRFFYLLLLYSSALADEPTQDHNNAIVNFSFFLSMAGLFTISWIVPTCFLVKPSRRVAASNARTQRAEHTRPVVNAGVGRRAAGPQGHASTWARPHALAAELVPASS